MDLRIEINPNPSPVSFSSPDELGFGKIFTPHMFQMHWSVEEGWHDAEIVPYHKPELDPATQFIHYGASIFEGLKGYYSKDRRILLFRPDMNMTRMNASAARICMPQFDGEFVTHAIKRADQGGLRLGPSVAGHVTLYSPHDVCRRGGSRRPRGEFILFLRDPLSRWRILPHRI